MSPGYRFDSYELRPSHRTSEGFLICDAVVAHKGILSYRMDDGSVRKEFVPADTLGDPESLATLAGKPLTQDHPPQPITPDNMRDYERGGVLNEIEFREAGGYAKVSLVVRDAETIEKIERGDMEMNSPAYKVETKEESGTYQGEQYDAVQVKRGPYNHVAACEDARGDNAIIRTDSFRADSGKIGSMSGGGPDFDYHSVLDSQDEIQISVPEEITMPPFNNDDESNRNDQPESSPEQGQSGGESGSGESSGGQSGGGSGGGSGSLSGTMNKILNKVLEQVDKSKRALVRQIAQKAGVEPGVVWMHLMGDVSGDNHNQAIVKALANMAGIEPSKIYQKSGMTPPGKSGSESGGSGEQSQDGGKFKEILSRLENLESSLRGDQEGNVELPQELQSMRDEIEEMREERDEIEEQLQEKKAQVEALLSELESDDKPGEQTQQQSSGDETGEPDVSPNVDSFGDREDSPMNDAMSEEEMFEWHEERRELENMAERFNVDASDHKTNESLKRAILDEYHSDSSDESGETDWRNDAETAEVRGAFKALKASVDAQDSSHESLGNQLQNRRDNSDLGDNELEQQEQEAQSGYLSNLESAGTKG